MEVLVYGFLALVFGVFFLTITLRLFLTPLDDLYSNFRNTKDTGFDRFKRELFFKRIFSALAAAAFLVLAGVIIF